MSGVGSLDVLDGMENDPEVERNGMKSAAEHNAAHWQRILDIVASSSTANPQTYLMDDKAMEDRLYKIYQTNFGGGFGINLYNSTWEELHGSQMLLAKWRDVMMPFEGVMLDGAAANMLTLLRVNPLDDCTKTSAVLVVPRLQFMLVEVARLRAGCYCADFNAQRLTLRIQRAVDCLKDCIGEALADTFPRSEDAPASHIIAQLHLLSCITSEREDYAIPPQILRKTGAAKTVAALANATPRFGIVSAQATAKSLLELWKAGVQTLKLPQKHRVAASELARCAVTLATCINQRSLLPKKPQSERDASLVDIAADENNPIRGRYLVAKRAVAAGEVLMEESPVCRAPFEMLPPVGVCGWKRACCFHCCQDAEMCDPSWALPCEGCGIKAFDFCSVGCKRMFQAAHAAECPMLSTAVPTRSLDDPVPAVASFKVLLVLRAAVQALLKPESVRSLLSLEHHRELFRKHRAKYYLATEVAAERIERCMPSAHQTAFAALLPATVTATAALQQMFFAIDVNAFGIGPHACGLFGGVAPLCNHSCIENATHAFDEPSWYQTDDDGATEEIQQDEIASRSGIMRVRATTDIAAGEEIAFSYVPELHQPTAFRRERTSKHKFFECSCARCIDPTELGRVPLLPLGLEWDTLLTKADAARSAFERWELRRKIATNTELLIPKPAYHTIKGVAQEAVAEAALALLLKEPHRASEGLADEVEIALNAARRNFTVCNGGDSAPVRRVLQLEQRLAAVQPRLKAK
jgi:hypothetical protein